MYFFVFEISSTQRNKHLEVLQWGCNTMRFAATKENDNSIFLPARNSQVQNLFMRVNLQISLMEYK